MGSRASVVRIRYTLYGSHRDIVKYRSASVDHGWMNPPYRPGWSRLVARSWGAVHGPVRAGAVRRTIDRTSPSGGLRTWSIVHRCRWVFHCTDSSPTGAATTGTASSTSADHADPSQYR